MADEQFDWNCNLGSHIDTDAKYLFQKFVMAWWGCLMKRSIVARWHCVLSQIHIRNNICLATIAMDPSYKQILLGNHRQECGDVE